MKILVVEDEPRMREAIEKGLRKAGFAVDSTGSGIEGEDLVLRGSYDLVVLDIMLPDRDGTDVCRNIRKQKNATPILMLTALAATDEKVEGLDAGADDYLTKPFKFVELISRIRAILRRGNPIEGRILSHRDLELDLHTRRGKRGDQWFELPNKEFMLLELFLRHPGRVLTRQQIGEKIWDMNFDPSSNVVDVYISSLRKRIDKGADRSFITTLKGVGYKLDQGEVDAG